MPRTTGFERKVKVRLPSSSVKKVQLHFTFEIPMKPRVEPRVDPALAGARGAGATCACPGVGTRAHTTTALIAVRILVFTATSPFVQQPSRCSSPFERRLLAAAPASRRLPG